MKVDPAIPKPPAGAPRHRRWRVWWDWGVTENGATIVHTGWYAKSPAGDIVEATEYNALLDGIDTFEDSRGRDQGERLTPIEHKPARPPGTFAVWQPDPRRIFRP